MNIFEYGFFAQISYLEDKITKTLGELLGYFVASFSFWDILKILYLLN
jgi:hypothetical protein